MIMAIVAILMVGIIAYFHYVQGIFSATLSAMLAIVAAMLAFSYHEVIVRAFLVSKMPNAAHGLALVALFGVIYMVLRIIFDGAVPGNVRVPVLVDKIGSGVAGVVAGVFAVGIFLIAVQSLPFKPSIAGYSRYQLIDSVDAQVPKSGTQSLDSFMYEVLRSDRVNDAEHQTLLLPVDDWVVAMASHLSAGGSLAGTQTVEAVHPAYLDELFFQRLGMQIGSNRVAYNLPSGEKQVSLGGLYAPAVALPQADAEPAFIKHRFETTPLTPTLKPDANNVVLIVRFSVSRGNADNKDSNIRISPAAVRLMAGGKNYFPVGTLDQTSSPLVRANRLDDFIIAAADKPIDFVFDIPAEALGASPDPKNPAGALTVGAGVFLEVKRLGYIDLGNKEIARTLPEGNNGIVRRKNLPAPKI
jgi:hypothetical protein